MQPRLPPNPAISRLCAAFFLTASIRRAVYLFHAAFLWQRPGFFEPFWWAQAAVMLAFVLVSAFVGFRLLYLRPRSVFHALILGWICFGFSAVTSAQFIYGLAHNHTLQRTEQWAALVSGSVVSVLFPAVVVWLLHKVRSGEQDVADPLPAHLRTV